MLKENREPSKLPTSREEVEAELKNRTERLLNDEVFQANTKTLKASEVLEFINKDGIKVFANDFDAKVERCKKNIMAEYDSLDEGMDESQRMFKINSAEAKSILWEYVSGKNEGSGTEEADGRESEYSQEDLKKLVARVMYCDITLARGKYEMDRGSLETKIENVCNNSYFQRITQNLNKEMILDLLEKGGPKRLANKVKAAQQAPSAEEPQKEEKQEEIKENVPVVGEPDTVNSADDVKDNIDTASAEKREDNIVEEQQKEEEKQEEPPVNTVAEEKTSSEEDTKQEEIKENGEYIDPMTLSKLFFA